MKNKIINFINLARRLRNKINFPHTQKGFTLIELSLVLLIIGIIVASIIGGQKLIYLTNLSKARALTNSAPLIGMDDLTFWFETTSKNSFSTATPVNQTAISLWNDGNIQKTLKRNAVQATGANQPLYIASSINGLPALRFDGVNDFMQIASLDSSSIYLADQISIFIVFKTITNVAPSQVLLAYQSAVSNRVIVELFSSTTPNFDFVNDTTGRLTSSYSLSANKSIILSDIKSSSTQTIYVNGSSVGTKANVLSMVPFNGTFYIGQFTFGNLLANVDIGEIIVFSRGLDNYEKGEVEKYLSKKWGIKLT